MTFLVNYYFKWILSVSQLSIVKLIIAIMSLAAVQHYNCLIVINLTLMYHLGF